RTRTPHRRTRSRPDRSRGGLFDLDFHDLPVALDFLDQPGVAVGVLERHERRVAAPLGVDAGRLAGLAEVEGIAEIDAAAREVLARSLDVAHDEMQTVERARGHRADPGPDR